MGPKAPRVGLQPQPHSQPQERNGYSKADDPSMLRGSSFHPAMVGPRAGGVKLWRLVEVVDVGQPELVQDGVRQVVQAAQVLVPVVFESA